VLVSDTGYLPSDVRWPRRQILLAHVRIRHFADLNPRCFFHRVQDAQEQISEEARCADHVSVCGSGTCFRIVRWGIGTFALRRFLVCVQLLNASERGRCSNNGAGSDPLALPLAGARWGLDRVTVTSEFNVESMPP
jgi:hypothetical protein